MNDHSPHSYSSLPRGSSLGSTPATPRTTTPLDTAVVLRSVGFGKPTQQHCMVVARGRGHSVPNLGFVVFKFGLCSMSSKPACCLPAFFFMKTAFIRLRTFKFGFYLTSSYIIINIPKFVIFFD